MRIPLLNPSRAAFWSLAAALALIWSVGIFGRGFWTPDEPREADIAWRMSWQSDKAVPSLAGQAFCEKPPLTYWLAGAAISALGADAWVARMPNALYAFVTALAVGMLGRRSVNSLAGAAAAVAVSTFLLSYQVAIWLATDAPLLAAVSVALCGAYSGFYPQRPTDRWRGYTGMHAALALGFLSKSAAAWMVPALTLLSLMWWERRWRELLRFELYAGLLLQAAVILTWVWFVHTAPDGDADLRVFFWNNLVGRFAHVDAPQDLQYATAHRNFPGKYLVELPLYLWPWTLLVLAALRRAWIERQPSAAFRAVRFALAAFLPTLAVLSIAATARNIYLAPALPGLALLLGWWVSRIPNTADHWDRRAVYGTAVLLCLATIVIGAAALLVRLDAGAWSTSAIVRYSVLVGTGLLGSGLFLALGLKYLRGGLMQRSLVLLVLSYCMLLGFPASALYRQVDAWQDFKSTGHAIAKDAKDRPLILFAPDETTRAFIDMYARTSVLWIPGPVDPGSLRRLRDTLTGEPGSVVAIRVQVPKDGRGGAELPEWAAATGLHATHVFTLRNGRSYALLEKK